MYMQPGPKKTAILRAQKLRLAASDIKDQRDNAIREAHDLGATYEEIASFCAISKSAIAKICTRNTPRPKEETDGWAMETLKADA